MTKYNMYICEHKAMYTFVICFIYEMRDSWGNKGLSIYLFGVYMGQHHKNAKTKEV